MYNNIQVTDNILRLAGYGWGSIHRLIAGPSSHICGWVQYGEKHIPKQDCKNFVIKNNIFDCSASYMIYWAWRDGYDQPGLTITDNTFYQRKLEKLYHEDYVLTPTRIMLFGKGSATSTATNQKTLTEAVKLFDKNAKKVKWLS